MRVFRPHRGFSALASAVAFSFLALAFVLHAQEITSITGAVTDTTGAVVPGADVILQNASTGASYKAVANAEGSYTISDVPPGPGYKITFTHEGFSPTVITGIYLNVSTTRTQNGTLHVGSASQTVQVSAASQGETLNTTDATIGNNFQVSMLNDLPVQNRDSPAALFYQQPGVTLTGAVTGARTDQSNVTLDGLEMNDDATGGFGDIVSEAPVDSVQEFRGVVGDPDSSSGQGSGGQFELVTRSGTNQFHGLLDEYHRDTDTEANDWFNNNAGVPRPPLVRNQFGGNIGGPIWRNKAFFFFDYDGRRDARSIVVDRTVPLPQYLQGEVGYINQSGATTYLSPSQVAALDPQGIGWDQAELKLFNSAYPSSGPNDTTGDVGDLVNTAGYRFNAPDPYVEDVYVERIDYTLNDKMKLFGRATVARRNSIENPKEFPGDPTYTFPFYDRSYNWAVGHTWIISSNKLNQAEIGETYEDFDFGVTYNPYGTDQYTFGGLSGPYNGGNNAQARTFPIPILRDDFSWEKGRHSFSFGGTFKWESPQGFADENYYFPSVGVTGNTNFTTLSPNLRPADISSSSSAVNIYDTAFSTALGAVADVSGNFNYNNKGSALSQGSGLTLTYRSYETELYFGDSWKITPNLTLTYGLRYQNYSVPYEIHGGEAVPQMMSGSSVSAFNFDKYWADRIQQSEAGISSYTAIPFFQYIYGGKANHAAGYYNPNNKDFSPHVAFAFTPGSDKNTVISGSINVVHDHTVVNALQFLQLQSSGLFEANNSNLFGTAGDPTATLATSSPSAGGAPRFGGLGSPPPAPSAPTISSPYTPYVASGFPYGLPYGEGNIVMNPQLKTPYSIEYDLGLQHQFPRGFILKINYDSRLGRRLLAEADASQLIDFPDNTGLSNQTMGQAFGALTTQLRQNAGLGPLGAILAVTPQPWFEDVITPGAGVANGFASNTQMIAYDAYPYPQRGDFSDAMYVLSTIGFPSSILPPNVGMASQYATNTVWTNKGFSDYDGMLVTLHKNTGFGLSFDFNYTWSHSIDNVSAPADFVAESQGFGFICDVARPRECRGNSDFDVTNYFNGNFIYTLPFGRGQTFGANIPFWLNEAAGGWEISGIPTWHTGNAYNASSNAYVAGFANNAPATLIGPPGLLKVKIHGGDGQPLAAFADSTAALAAFTGPTGFAVGSRNNLRGPGYFNIDLGLGKTFPLYGDRVNLKFRCDAFNALNHPNFAYPGEVVNGVVTGSADITQSNGVPFGTIGSTVIPPGSDLASRVLQGALRLEF